MEILMTKKKINPKGKTRTSSRKTEPATLPSDKKGFYEKVLDTAEALDFEAVLGQEGLDDEIALLRIKIKELVNRDPDNIELIMQATNMLARMVKIRYGMTKGQKKNLGEAIKNVIREIGVPLGVAVINKKL
jgi:hypothetical protein